MPWKDLEEQAWIATATCVEIRVPMSAERRMAYALAERRVQFRVAAENPAKLGHLRDILNQVVPLVDMAQQTEEQLERLAQRWPRRRLRRPDALSHEPVELRDEPSVPSDCCMKCLELTAKAS